MYKIYEIIGLKVGCTVQTLSQRFKGNYYSYLKKGIDISDKKIVLLEVCDTVEEATRREKYWQKKKGYETDRMSYSHSLNLVTKYSHLAQTPEAKQKRKLNTDYKAIGKKLAEVNKKPIKAFSCRVQRSGLKGRVRVIADKVYLRTYNSLKEASKDLDVRVEAISMILSDKCSSLQTKGYTFELA